MCGGRRRTSKGAELPPSQQRSVMVTAKSKVDYRNKGGRGGRGGGRGGGGGRGRSIKLTQPTQQEIEGSTVLMDKCAAGGKHAPPTVVLKKDKAHLFRAGHPMVRVLHACASSAFSSCLCVGLESRASTLCFS